YCLERSHQPRLRLLTAIDRNCRLEDVPADALPDDNDPSVAVHWQTPDELATRFAAFPAAVAMTHTIAAQCRPALPDGRPVWPVPHLPAATTPAQALRILAEDGLTDHYGAAPPPAVIARLDRELAAIDAQGFTPLFLVVADVVGYAREKSVPVSTRGSVADSLAAFCVGITTVDPVRHDLLFERFLNPARTSLPDIDLDFCSRRRDEVLAYVRRTYGEEQTALVATVSTMKPKSAVRETAKAYGVDDATITRLVKLLPGGWHPDPRRRDKRSVDDVLAKLDDPHLRHVIRAAYELVGQPHHLSIHPGGVVITPGPVTDYAPVQWTVKGFRITQFDHGDVEAIGLPKIDLLGIRALTVLADAAVLLVRAHHAPDFTLQAIPLDDEATGDLLARADTVGVFQCESTGAQRTLRQLKARSVQDLAVANAFFKPGPATGGMAQTFIRRYRGEEPTRYLHPALEPVLHTTKGVLIFQEQVLRIATAIAGLTWEEADHLRRGMSKFQPEEMTAMRARFVAGCCRPVPDGPGFTPAQAETLWQQVEAFAGYGFNQGHATAYADVSYRSAYLKAHWPAAFLCARLQDWGGFHHQAIYYRRGATAGDRDAAAPRQPERAQVHLELRR
ncbi:MAG: DNA polymerase III subunit alpha, partial [Caldilineaceae bacterium]|nr:DNA polymerase III subunit alpha [Caldilineaceae bacterium]